MALLKPYSFDVSMKVDCLGWTLSKNSAATIFISVLMEFVMRENKVPFNFLNISAKLWFNTTWFLLFLLYAVSHRPLTNYYQYSLGVLALCVSGIRVNNHVSNKLIKAVELEHFKHGDSESIGEWNLPISMIWLNKWCAGIDASHLFFLIGSLL